VRCPSCDVSLKIVDEERAAFVTCPRCLAAVENPGAGGSAPVCPQCGKANTSGAATCIACLRALEAPEASPGMRPCPQCGGAIRLLARRCRRCGSFVLPTPDDDVLANKKLFGCSFGLLSVLGGIGLAIFFATALPDRGIPVGPFLAAAFVLLAIAGLALSCAKGNRAAQGMARLIVGGLAVFGVIVVIPLVLGLAILTFFVFYCAVGGGF
jgi:predicted RNA-binding Zn-ribbon protein involved in translation (DUF1610 family)